MKFSERYGHAAVRAVIQIESMDDDLRNGLWNAIDIYFWRNLVSSNSDSQVLLHYNTRLRNLGEKLWLYHFKEPIDEMPDRWSSLGKRIRSDFFGFVWNEVYDFAEFIAQVAPARINVEGFIERCNLVMEDEMSAYRFVGDQIAPITDKVEIAEIDEALDKAIGPIRTHLTRALELLSDREKRDYRNSVKESISAVESLAKNVTGKSDGTLGRLLDRISDDHDLHPKLKDAFKSLYGYTSDDDGIRHAIMERETVTFEDAKFMLVTCSAFCNYVPSIIVEEEQ